MLAVDTLEVQTLKSRKQISFEPRREMLQIKPLKKPKRQEKGKYKEKEKKRKAVFCTLLKSKRKYNLHLENRTGKQSLTLIAGKTSLVCSSENRGK